MTVWMSSKHELIIMFLSRTNKAKTALLISTLSKAFQVSQWVSSIPTTSLMHS
jgi:hypothetical protein